MSREALVVGINFYKKITGFNSLKIPSEDAAEIARILAEEGEFSVTQLPEAVKDGEIRVGQQGGVTQKELIDALKQLFIPKGKNIPDTALFYFAGHGILSEEGLVPEGYLVTSDANPAEGKWGLSLKQLRELLEGSEVRQQLIWLDCCHSGALLNFNQADPKDAGKARDRCFIAASREFEPAYEQLQGNHGVLTGALLQGLNAEQCPAGQWVTNLLLVHSIHQAMEVERRQRKIPQRPVYTIFGEAINLIRGQAQAEKALKNAVSEECPYQGLKAFEEEQKQFFFGRQQVIDKIRHKLNQKAFVPIIGASGTGKSSVVRAGLIPLLKERESGWRVLKPIKPGIEPLTELRGAFKEFFQGAKEKQLYAFIKNDPEGLLKLIERLPDSERFLLVIDQFEEVFTVCPLEEDRQRFIELITQVAEIPDSRLTVITTMRADFLEPCLQYESLTQLIQNQAIYMPPLMGADLEKAIAKPAELQGYRLEDGLLGTILNDVKGAGSLPLLQFALTELWEKRDRQKQQLTLEQYEVMEGAIGSLNRHAQKVYTYKDFSEDSPTEERTEQEQEWIKRIVLKLVRTGQDEKDTRQRQPKGKLLAIAGDNPEEREALNEVIDELVQGRLLVTGEAEEKTDILTPLNPPDAGGRNLAPSPFRGGLGRGSSDSGKRSITDLVEDAKMIDLAHEALMEGWTQFAEWRQEDRQLRRLIDRMDDAWREWEKQPKDENLMMGGLLAQVRQEWQNLEAYLEPTLQDFYQRSDAHEQDRIAQLQQALTESKLREQAARVLHLLPVQPLDALVLAIQTMGLNLDQLGEGKILTPVQESLNEAMKKFRQTNAFQSYEEIFKSVAFSPDGQMIVSGTLNGTVRLWDIEGNVSAEPFRGHEDYVWSVAFSPDGQMIISGSWDKTVRLWDIEGNALAEPFRGHEERVSSVAFSPDGQMIVSSSYDGTVRLWDTRGNQLAKPFRGHKNFVYSVAFSPDGQMIVSSSADKTVRLWDTRGNQLTKPFQGHKNFVYSVAFSPDGQMIVSGSADKTVRLWDTRANQLGELFPVHKDGVHSVAFSPDGQMIISDIDDNTLQLWDLQGNPIAQPWGHEDAVDSVAFSPDGQMVVSSCADGTVQLWQVRWKSCLQVCCDTLRDSPVFKNPQTEVEKQACETCQKYVWSREES